VQRPGLRLLVIPDTILRWHRDIIRRRYLNQSTSTKHCVRRQTRAGGLISEYHLVAWFGTHRYMRLCQGAP
jgi:hypothetical protein